MNKITIVGAGRVGESTAQFIAAKKLCSEIVMLDINEGAAKGAALDIQEVSPLFQYDTRLIGGVDHALMADSGLIIITAGLPKPGMSRTDVLASNIPIMDGIIDGAMKYAPDAILLFVTNPVDVITYHAFIKTGWSRNRVFGQAGVLDSSRMASFIAMETGYSIMDIYAMVLGGHGDTMVPMLRYCTIAGIPIERFIAKDKIDSIVERTRNGGAEIPSSNAREMAVRKFSPYEKTAAHTMPLPPLLPRWLMPSCTIAIVFYLLSVYLMVNTVTAISRLVYPLCSARTASRILFN
jgi:malate dehydrogenase